jgi:hypothetical protein
VQQGETKLSGIELEGRWNLGPGLSVYGAYTYTDSEVARTTDLPSLGKKVALVPRQQASAGFDYTLTQGALAGFGGGARYVGRHFGDIYNQWETPGYTLFDAALHYDLERWRLQLNASNLLDKELRVGLQQQYVVLLRLRAPGQRDRALSLVIVRTSRGPPAVTCLAAFASRRAVVAGASDRAPHARQRSLQRVVGGAGRSRDSDDQRRLGVLTVAPREREIRFRLVQNEIKEQSRLGGDRANDVILLAERDEDVFDTVGEPEALHRLHLRAHDLGIAGRREIEIQTAADASERHAAVRVDQRRAQRAVGLQQVRKAFVDIGHGTSPS